ncbi:dipeptide/oligopeptide/nickel ABC transporter ATP-binding protein [Metabacillus idriensis]|uniref:ATP-binding cassette domain-containing protein n=1 Tax=Metabacillus idriensis TaxID=324768 RepID=A0A6I2MBW4_9BACI|nr:dipeptide/oligopeptide/nickel ABC transporter ATP-binding protein [Metabacillus idriensis]MCM3596677.1 dipeptide/oligopeptide/nickel ABC transporter ATP-binding protein [Metabacillus idriensis]MRX55239.1 ATP-binding cassette domain-containing protein [Metabacillus idriensis]OHR73380.1 peptide ABC transporter ATP-binding protein [Bacillus sp. HMSC76G11]
MQMLTVSNITKSYRTHNVLSDVSFTIRQGECLGLIGESGSGKSTLAKLILGLDSADEGEIILNGVRLNEQKGRALKKVRRHIQVVFQNPHASLNPKLPIWKSVAEPLENYPEAVPAFLLDVKKDRKKMALRLLEMVGLNGQLLERYPHQLSGGQRQRVAIARGISIEPKILICDEPTSSLDVSVQAQILNLLKDLKEEFGMSFLFISHDMAAVRFMSDRMAVLKEGILVDSFSADELFSETRHHYTKQLTEAGMERGEA